MFKIPIDLFKQWRSNREGTAAVEFALVGIPFLLMVISIIEMALMFTAQSILEGSTAVAARQIRTGAVQQGGGLDLFETTLCDFASILIPCDAIQVQVIPLDSFGDAPDASFDVDGNLENQEFDAGGVSDIVMVRTAYKYRIATPLMQPILSNNGSTNRIMFSTVVLQAEPYEFEGGG